MPNGEHIKVNELTAALNDLSARINMLRGVLECLEGGNRLGDIIDDLRAQRGIDISTMHPELVLPPPVPWIVAKRCETFTFPPLGIIGRRCFVDSAVEIDIVPVPILKDVVTDLVRRMHVIEEVVEWLDREVGPSTTS
ncbi:MAG: hypothetical protein JSU96_01150 [Acidobacteriota bacterium]|nr:MAG: hypothetical protein JSU96_01150 [Acidobacteriota bacterium]